MTDGAAPTPRARVRFVVVGTGARLGSNLLVTALDRHPDAACAWEIFNPAHYPGVAACDGRARVERLYARATTSCIGFKLFAEQARSEANRNVWDWLGAERDIRIVHLARRDRLAQYVSLRTALETRRWGHALHETPELVRVALDPDACVQWLRGVARLEAELETRFAAHPRLHLVYEDDVDGGRAAATLARVQHFLDLPVQSLEPSLRKSAVGTLAERVVNLDAVLGRLRREGLLPEEAYDPAPAAAR